MCIIMFAILLLLSTLGATFAGYAGGSSSSNDVGGYGYGYSGSYSGSSGAGTNFIPPPFPDFENFLTGYLDSFQKYHEQFMKTLQQHAAQISAGQNKAGYAPGYQSYGPGDNVKAGSDGSAVASASIGPQGGYQSAAVYPENPNSPNIFTRFGGAETPQSAGGSFGVFTSSVSSSSNVNGKPQTFRSATTTINDNGKVSTYSVKSP